MHTKKTKWLAISGCLALAACDAEAPLQLGDVAGTYTVQLCRGGDCESQRTETGVLVLSTFPISEATADVLGRQEPFWPEPVDSFRALHPPNACYAGSESFGQALGSRRGAMEWRRVGDSVVHLMLIGTVDASYDVELRRVASDALAGVGAWSSPAGSSEQDALRLVRRSMPDEGACLELQ